MPFVKPNPDKKLEDGTLVQVFDNVRKDFLPEDGRMVPANAYWNRMLRRGDVVEVKPPAPPEPAADFPLYNENGEPVDEDGTVLMKAYMADGTQVWVPKEEQFTPEEIEYLKAHPELVASEEETRQAIQDAETQASEPNSQEAEKAGDAPKVETDAEPPAADEATAVEAKSVKKSAAKSKTKTE